jgi:hypothetical protein
LKLPHTINTRSAARLDFQRCSVYRITTTRLVCLLRLLDVARALQKVNHVGLRNRFVDTELFRSGVDAGGACEDFTGEQVIDATGKNRPVVDQDTEYYGGDKHEGDQYRRTEQSPQHSSGKARPRFHVRHDAWFF